MKNLLPLPEDKKITVLYRVEPGCLGPDGANYVSEFCSFAQAELRRSDSDYVSWEIVPRHDKSLPELQYSLASKLITDAQANKFLSIFDEMLDDFECALGDKLEALIDRFMSAGTLR